MFVKKNEKLSIAKGIGIALMVVGHSGAPTFVHDFIYLFHMALFYFASGYFFNENYLKNKKEFVWKRIKGLYFPFLKYGLLFLFLHNTFFYLNIYNGIFGFKGEVSSLYKTSDYLHSIFIMLTRFSGSEPLLGAFWFLKSLFICSIFYCFSFWICMKIAPKNVLVLLSIMIGCIFLIGGILNYYSIYLPLGIGREFVIISIFHIAFLYHRYEKFVIYNNSLLIGSFLLLYLCANYKTIEVGYSLFYNIFYFLMVSCCGCYMVMNISDKIKRTKAKSLFICIGNNTMIILTFHFLMFKIVSLIKIGYYNFDFTYLAKFPIIENNNNYWWLLYSIVGILAPLFLQLLFNKVGRIVYLWRYLLFGRITSFFFSRQR